MAAPTDLKKVISSGVRRPATVPRRQLEQIAEDGLLADHAGGQRLHDVAGLARRRRARVSTKMRARRTTASSVSRMLGR